MRKYLVSGGLVCFALVVAIGPAPGRAARLRTDPLDASGPLDITHFGVDQVGRDLRLSLRTQGEFDLGALDARPNLRNPDNRFLCLRIRATGGTLVRVFCFGTRPNGDRNMLGYGHLSDNGSLASWKPIGARVERPSGRAVVARFRPANADLNPHAYRWRYLSRWTGPLCPSSPPAHRARRAGADPCSDRAPNGRAAKLRLRRVQRIGCTDPGPSPRFNGSRRHKRVALTFDDGPSAYTPKILKILERNHAKGTFFEIGEQVPGLPQTARAVIRSGNELGNHSLHHETRPGRPSMAETNRRIKAATGFRPCLFRPPGGAYDSRVVGDASSLGMTTVIWDVDPADWSRPGAGAIYVRVVTHTRPGSIVIMHDGGGDRSQTVAALPHIIHTLRARGYSFLTVTKLLHGRFVWGPVG